MKKIFYTICLSVICLSTLAQSPQNDWHKTLDQYLEIHNYEAALTLISIHLEAEEGIAMYDMAVMYYHGWGVEQSFEKSEEWYLKAMEYGVSYAYTAMGSMYEKGCGHPADIEKALSFYETGALLGDPKAKEAIERLKGNK